MKEYLCRKSCLPTSGVVEKESVVIYIYLYLSDTVCHKMMEAWSEGERD